MHWNYRMVEFRDTTDPTNAIVEICEVFYDKTGKPTGYTPASVMAEGGVTEMKNEIDRISLALGKPILYAATDFSDAT
jgi:hypothetical protein